MTQIDRLVIYKKKQLYQVNCVFRRQPQANYLTVKTPH